MQNYYISAPYQKPMAQSSTSTSAGNVRTARGPSRRTLTIVVVVLCVGIFITSLNIYELRRMQMDHYGHGGVVEASPGGQEKKQPIYVVHGKRVDSGYLRHVFAVFDRLGYRRGTLSESWDVLWAHDYPFKSVDLKHLKPHQRVNHWPGSGFVTNKATLVTLDKPFIPKAFKLPGDKDKFLQFSNEHPDWKWVVKSNNHRGIAIKSVKDMNLSSSTTFVQQYVDDPLLVDGRRFDIGVYTAVTSVNPLRIYMYTGDWLVRYCPKVYEPFIPSDKDKYVISDDYMPTWKVPALKKVYVDMGYSFQDTLLWYIRKQGMNSSVILTQIQQAIQQVILSKEKSLINALSYYQSKRNFFEMVRFDFVVDKNLKVFLMEVNMSPNLSSGHFPPNKLLYEQVLYGLMSLVGIAHDTEPEEDVLHGSSDETKMTVAAKNIHVYVEKCNTAKCLDNCMAQECKLCNGCLTVAQKNNLKAAYIEHVNRRTYRRVFPPPFTSQGEAEKWSAQTDHTFQSQYSNTNKIMAMWFHGKCLQDVTWCQ